MIWPASSQPRSPTMSSLALYAYNHYSTILEVYESVKTKEEVIEMYQILINDKNFLQKTVMENVFHKMVKAKGLLDSIEQSIAWSVLRGKIVERFNDWNETPDILRDN